MRAMYAGYAYDYRTDDYAMGGTFDSRPPSAAGAESNLVGTGDTLRVLTDAFKVMAAACPSASAVIHVDWDDASSQ